MAVLPSIQCGSKEKISFFAPNSSVVFRSNKFVRINGTRFSELNCTSHDSLARKLCSNITEVTCQERLGKIESCAVSNKDSTFFNNTVADKTIVCNRWRQIAGNCYLVFSPDTRWALQFIEQQKNGVEFVSNPFSIVAIKKAAKRPSNEISRSDL